MMQIPDAPWIREAERRGTDYMYEFIFGKYYRDDEDDDWDDEDDEDEEDDEYDDEDEEEITDFESEENSDGRD